MAEWNYKNFLFNLPVIITKQKEMYRINYLTIVLLQFPILLPAQDIAQWRGPERGFAKNGLLLVYERIILHTVR